MDKDKCWEQIDVIIEVLDTGFRYLATDEIQETVFERFNGIKRLSLYDDVKLGEDEQRYIDQIAQKFVMEQNKNKLQRKQSTLRKLTTNQLPTIQE